MHIFIRSVFLAGAIALSGCAIAPSIEKETPFEIASRSRIGHDDFRKVTTVDGQALLFGDFGQNRYWLAARKLDADTNALYEVLFKTVRGSDDGWAFWSEAFDDNGHQLPVQKLGSEVGDSGMTYELIAVQLTRDYINEHRVGIKMRVDGQRAQQIVVFPSNYIEGFLLKVNSAGL